IYAASAALNCGVAGATYFGIRGYFIVPILNQVLPSRLHEQERLPKALASSEESSSRAVTWGAMRLHRALDSALSGGITGSVLNTWRRGTRGTFTGMMFGSVFCTIGQLLYNEFHVQRIRFISRRYPAPSSRPPPPTRKKPLFDRLIHAAGLKRLSDEEYLTQMREKRAAYLQRIAELEAQVEADKDLEHP
ncbi:hypothetical protein BJV78DRAFT_1117210, partial [Lactifluus subvellereus]